MGGVLKQGKASRYKLFPDNAYGVNCMTIGIHVLFFFHFFKDIPKTSICWILHKAKTGSRSKGESMQCSLGEFYTGKYHSYGKQWIGVVSSQLNSIFVSFSGEKISSDLSVLERKFYDHL